MSTATPSGAEQDPKVPVAADPAAAGEGGVAAAGGEQLACGRSADSIVEQVATGHGSALDDHQRTCPHCQAALAETSRLWAPLLQVAARPVPPPSGDLVARIIEAVRTLARHSTFVQLPSAPDDRGRTRLSASAISDIAQAAASGVPGVRLVFGRSSGVQPERAAGSSEVGIIGQSVVVDLAVIVDFGARIPQVADTIRQRVIRALDHQAATRATRINVHVHDVLPPLDSP